MAHPRPGFSSGQAEAAMTKLVNENLPRGMSYEWTELTYQRILAGNTVVYVGPLCLLLVFLVLAALYESFRLPLAIILIVPMRSLFTITGVGSKAATTISSPRSADRAGGARVQKRHLDCGICQTQTG